MADAVRFFFDEHLPNAAVTALRGQGVDVLTVVEAGRVGRDDDEQLRFAMADGRAVVTHDPDYLALAADFQSRGEPFAGVVYGEHRVYAHRPGLLIHDLLILHGVYTADDMRDRLEYL